MHHANGVVWEAVSPALTTSVSGTTAAPTGSRSRAMVPTSVVPARPSRRVGSVRFATGSSADADGVGVGVGVVGGGGGDRGRLLDARARGDVPPNLRVVPYERMSGWS